MEIIIKIAHEGAHGLHSSIYTTIMAYWLNPCEKREQGKFSFIAFLLPFLSSFISIARRGKNANMDSAAEC